jgi:glycosyltransferase involved in cell wall biosynthesis
MLAGLAMSRKFNQGSIALRSPKHLIYKLAVYGLAKGFDANFYVSYYEDLKKLRGKSQALKHYIIHGKSEGRFPNEKSYFKNVAIPKHGIDDFDLSAYKFYNKDLVSKFGTDEEFIRHYLRHGKNEKRPCSFPKTKSSEIELPIKEKWKRIFSTSEFLAWCGNELHSIPVSKEEALEIFCEQGIENLWPINFEYAFDVEFSRNNSTMPEHGGKSDADLYRAWLTEGFPAGVAPNERLFLASYIGGLPFPLSFDWQGFARRSHMSRTITRSQALIALFESPARNIVRYIDLMGQDAAWLLEYIGRRAQQHGDHRKAVSMFTKSIAIAPMAGSLCLLGDSYRNLGATKEALEAYLASADINRAPIWSFLHAAAIYASRNQFPEAFGVLHKAYPFWRQKPEFVRKLHEIVQLYFDHQSARAHILYRETAEQSPDLVKRQAVDDFLTESLDKIRAVYLEMDSLPASVGGNPEGYVAILANDDLRQCKHYRIEQKALQFEHAGIPVRIFSHSDVQDFMDSFVGARAAIFYRVAAIPNILRAILHANSMDLDTYYEIDDLIFDSSCYPDPFSSFEGQISAAEYTGLQFGVPLFRYAMSMCKASIASTPALAERMQAVTATNVNITLRNGLDERNRTAITMGFNPIRRESGRVHIFYGSGTKAHNADFNRLVAPAVLDLMQRHPHVDLVIVGHLKLMTELSAMGERIITYPFISDVTTYWSILASCDINLAVLEPGIAADCKSEIKWLEAAILQIPSIVSGTRTYREVIEHGVDGFIADSSTEWHDVLQELITTSDLRERIGAKARKKALRDYDLQVASQTLKSAFKRTLREKVPVGERPLRVLVCNVFFAPQSYGGATRVVEDNVRTFTELYPDLEIGIFCSDEGAATPGRLSLGTESGIPVYRLSTPRDIDRDRRPFNEAHAEPFERVLDHFQPDLLHFHCIQHLTATIVEVALRRDIPYIVTLHDAWWISDNQFLVDEDGLLQLPSTDILADYVSSDRLDSISRRQRLTSLLQNSQANLSVSAPFAKIYAEAGVTALRVVENGTPFLETIARSPRRDGRVALGHVGGRSAHKGASLIEATLRRGSYKNLHLTMVDGTLAPGQSVDTLWGTTPVTLTAPFAQTQVAQLYGQLDILLAPSTWPESFGLVTREALNSGLWVVTSNLGAIGQNVDNGRNGYVIDVATTDALSQVLSMIDMDPERFRALPPAGKNVTRTMTEQASEVYSIYWEIFDEHRAEAFRSEATEYPVDD